MTLRRYRLQHLLPQVPETGIQGEPLHPGVQSALDRAVPALYRAARRRLGGGRSAGTVSLAGIGPTDHVETVIATTLTAFSVDRPPPTGSVAAFAHTCLQRRITDHLRAATGTRRGQSNAPAALSDAEVPGYGPRERPDDLSLLAVAVTGPVPEDVAAYKEVCAALRKAVADLPVGQREAVEARLRPAADRGPFGPAERTALNKALAKLRRHPAIRPFARDFGVE